MTSRAERAACLPANLPPRLLSRDQAAAYCGVAAGTLATHYKGPSVEIGNRVLFDIRDLDAFIDSLKPNAVKSGPVTADEWLERLDAGNKV